MDSFGTYFALNRNLGSVKKGSYPWRPICGCKLVQAHRWNIGGNVWSLDQIEHVQIREQRSDRCCARLSQYSLLRTPFRVVHSKMNPLDAIFKPK